LIINTILLRFILFILPKLHVFSSMLWCTRKNDVQFVLTPTCFVGDSRLINVICIYAYWCPTLRFLYQLKLVSFNSSMVGVTSGTETA